MKKIYSILFMLVALVATVNAQETPKGDAYKGVLTIQLGEGETAGEPLELPDQTVYIDMNEDGTSCTFGLYNFAMGPEAVLGDIVVENVVVTTEDNVKSYAGSKKDILLHLYEQPIYADASVTGTETQDGTLDMHIPVIWKKGAGESAAIMPIHVWFKGTKEQAGIANVAVQSSVYGANGVVVVNGFEGVVEVYDFTGRLVKSAQVAGNAEVALAKGLYIVRTGAKAAKVVVK